MSAQSRKPRPLRIRGSAGRTDLAQAKRVTRSPAASKSSGPRRQRSGATTYFENLFGYEWELTKSPAGANQWKPKNGAGAGTVPDAYDPSKRHAPSMLTTDLSLRLDPAYAKISRRFHENPEEFADAFAKAWYKLTHRDMGPISRYLGPLVPKEPNCGKTLFLAVDHELIGEQDIAALKAKILASGLSDLPTGRDGLGVGGDVPRHRQARWGERGAHSPCAAKGLGSEPAGRTGEGPAGAGGDPKGVQRFAVRGEKGLAC